MLWEIEERRGRKLKFRGKITWKVLSVINADMYYSPCLVAEDLEGNFIPVGTDDSNAVNWYEIDETEWLNELKMRDNL